MRHAVVQCAAEFALACVEREYPNAIAHVLNAQTDAATPQTLHPAFYGCFDWHSAVHGHWTLARVARTIPNHALAARARDVLERSLTAVNLDAELAYLQAPNRRGFERPYGLAWLLQLSAEMHEWGADDVPGASLAAEWRNRLNPLANHVTATLTRWLEALRYPVRSGTHNQTAFSLALVHDYATTTGNGTLARDVANHCTRLFGDDRNRDWRFEPSGHDFLSPVLAEADLMRRVLAAGPFNTWLGGSLPELPALLAAFEPADVADPNDGHLVHLHGLNLSRAFMLRGIAHALEPHNALRDQCDAVAETHAAAGFAALPHSTYAGSHWLGTFALYLETNRGIRQF